MDLLNLSALDIGHYTQIPFLPISFFKTRKVLTGHNYEMAFESSGTTGENTSKHYVSDLSLYEESIYKGFEYFFGNPNKFRFLFLLPGYLERENSSLVYMANHLTSFSKYKENGFYLREHEELLKVIQDLEFKNELYLLMGVSYAMEDLSLVCKKDHVEINHGLLFETGGMKGKRKEKTKEAFHKELKDNFSVAQVFSEYGMTELLSQAYLMGDSKFHCPPWMKVMGREINDPLDTVEQGRSLGLNVIDLANVNSCSFIATEDHCSLYPDGSFNVLGRLENTIARGCNLLLD